MKKAILWDFDGTLSYPNKSFFTALHTAIIESGYSITQNEVTLFLEKAYSWKVPDISYPDNTGEKWWEQLIEKLNCFCAEKGIEALSFEKIASRFRQLLTNVENYCLYSDALETLKQCTALGYNNYLATNNYPEITRNIELLGIAPYLSGCIISSLIGYEKPKKEFFDYAKTMSGNPDLLYMIGDNPIADIRGGNDAGITTVAVHACKNSEADYYFENLSDILKMLK